MCHVGPHDPTCNTHEDHSRRSLLLTEPTMCSSSAASSFYRKNTSSSSQGRRCWQFVSDCVQISNFESPHFQQRTKSPFSTPSSSVSQKSWILMFQKQQTILQQLLEGQTRLEQRQDSFGDQLAHMTSKVEHSMPTTSSSSNEGKRKRMVTRSLSVSFFPVC